MCFQAGGRQRPLIRQHDRMAKPRTGPPMTLGNMRELVGDTARAIMSKLAISFAR
jgi:hypothetical protein